MTQNQRLYEEAVKIMPGGVNSPVRAFRAVGMTPRFIVRGKGDRIFDADGAEYIDYVMSWGPLVLGHAREEVVKAASEAAESGLTFGAPTGRETELAELGKELLGACGTEELSQRIGQRIQDEEQTLQSWRKKAEEIAERTARKQTLEEELPPVCPDTWEPACPFNCPAAASA